MPHCAYFPNIFHQNLQCFHLPRRRVFLDKITMEDARIYMSFYLEATNREVSVKGKKRKRLGKEILVGRELREGLSAWV